PHDDEAPGVITDLDVPRAALERRAACQKWNCEESQETEGDRSTHAPENRTRPAPVLLECPPTRLLEIGDEGDRDPGCVRIAALHGSRETGETFACGWYYKRFGRL